MLAASDIQQMSQAERLAAMEMLWAAIAGDPVPPESPEWHGKVLRERMDKIESGEGKFLTVSELKARLGR